MNRLKERYENEISKSLMTKFNYNSVMQVPAMEKIVINIGVGDAVSNSKLLDEAVEELTIITGQKPVVTTAKKSIAGFKLREGMPIGCKVTLRGERMYEFLDKLVNIDVYKRQDGYDAIQVGFEDKREKLATKAHKGHVAKAETAPKRFIKEFRYDEMMS